MAATLRNFHLPLPEPVYRALREEAVAAKRPATALAREAIEVWLEDRRQALLHEAIAEYAVRHAGTPADLDPDLEWAGLERLRSRGPRRRQRRRR
jgi:hypothetical protein